MSSAGGNTLRVQWHDVDVEALDGTVERRRYPFLGYWMQKRRRWHQLPLHPSDADVVTRQQNHLRAPTHTGSTAPGGPGRRAC
jgi:hypothetical protein